MRTALFVLALALTLTPLAVAHAQDGGPPPEYRPLVDSALDEFDAGHWAEARALFERAHTMFPNARTLRGIGMAAFELRDYVAARRALEAALVETRRSLTDEQRAQVTDLVTRARVFVGDFGVGPAPEGSTLDVDGVPTTPDGDLTSHATLPLAVGAHDVVLRAPDGRSARAQVTVHGGETAELSLAIGVPEPVATGPSETRAPPRPPPPSSDPGPGPWILVGAGGAALIAGAVLVGLGASEADAVNGAPAGTEWADLAPRYDRIVPYEGIGIALLAIGAGCVAGGLAWQLGSSSGSSASVAIGPGSLSVRGSF